MNIFPEFVLAPNALRALLGGAVQESRRSPQGPFSIKMPTNINTVVCSTTSMQASRCDPSQATPGRFLQAEPGGLTLSETLYRCRVGDVVSDTFVSWSHTNVEMPILCSYWS